MSLRLTSKFNFILLNLLSYEKYLEDAKEITVEGIDKAVKTITTNRAFRS